MKKKTRKKRNFRQQELPCRPMFEAELPGMPEKPKAEAGTYPQITINEFEIISKAAAICAKKPGVLEDFWRELSLCYPEDGKPISIISIIPKGEKGVYATL